ncbi:MAG: multidrug efflux RND transporter permease subunit [Betaproteobacteria bacterium]|nr:multidrug efflux RND transporter permease subunit [Betaproteobacteria bacterium]
MNFFALFINRPVGTSLLTLGPVLAGALAFRLLPVAPLPQVDFPTISVSASLPGASPETMAATVATPLERAFSRIAGVTEMTSWSTAGSTRVTLQFDLDRNIDGAARDVQAAINAARGLLPTGLPRNPTYRKVNPADAPIMILAMTSDTMTRGQMYDVASTILVQSLSQVEGIGQVDIGGGSLPAVRVETNPTVLNSYGISLDAVREVIVGANAYRPKGIVEDDDRRWQVAANDQAKTAAEYLPLIVAYRNGAAVRLADVAQVVDSVQDLRNTGSSNGRPAVMLILRRQPGANIIATVDRVKELLPQLRAAIPAAINLELASDRTPTIRASLREVEKALLIAAALVVMVVFLFLRNARAAIIPSVAVPVSVIGTFSIMYLAGFSLDNLSLMALVIATGFVVDDAIVVVENVSRHLERGETPAVAALKGVREVGFTVLSMSLSLVAVFIPILLMGGIVGRLFREFAVTLSAAILVSLLVSLTTTPAMCARLLRPLPDVDATRRGVIGGGRTFERLLRGYRRSLSWALQHGPVILVLLFLTVLLNIYLYVAIPKGFFPQQDTGRLVGSIRGDQSISFQAMSRKLADFMTIVRSDPDVASVVGYTGGGQRNSGVMFVALKPRAEGRASADQVIKRLRAKLSKEPGASLFFRAVQDVRIGARGSSSQFEYTLLADDLAQLRAWEPMVRKALGQISILQDVDTDQQDKGLQTTVTIDRDAAARLGVTPKMIDTALNNSFGQRQVATIYNPLNQYQVVLEVAPPYWQSPETLKSTYVSVPPGAQLPQGAQIPLAAIASFAPTNTALGVSHDGQFASSTISFNLEPGISLSDATRAVGDAVARLGMPSSIHGVFGGTAGEFERSLASQPWLILAALVSVFIVLGILYESYIHPLTILSTLPSAGVGALLALMASGSEFSIVAFIGVILLIGIVKKNAIMMVDFALSGERERGLSPRDAIFEACVLRFRPIMMTTVAALLAAVPLALGSGDGAELRRPLGVSIVGGLLVSQVLTLYTTPVVYLYLDRLRCWSGRRLREAARVVSAAPRRGIR